MLFSGAWAQMIHNKPAFWKKSRDTVPLNLTLQVIPAFEMVMRARTNVYHLECFACQQCGHR